jgi:hypothetical protein
MVAIPLLIVYEPFWIWMPMITFLASPYIGGSFCIFNRIENHFRRKAVLPPIEDRFYDFIMYVINKIKRKK